MPYYRSFLALLTIGACANAFAENLIVSYDVTVVAGEQTASSSFVFALSENTAAFVDGRKTYRDIWDRTGAGQVRLRRTVDVKASAIEFLPGELTLRGRMPKWESLQSPFGNDVRGNCAERAAHVVECVAGDTLPAKVTMRFERFDVRWTQVTASRDTAEFARLTEVPTEYRLWDAADFGDQEYDRDLQALLPYAELDPHSTRIHAANELTHQHGPNDGHRH